jgi:hypothetical protein
MKFQRAAQITRVPPDLLLLYTNTWLSVYCFHCMHGIVTFFKPKVILPDDSWLRARGIGGKRLFEGNGPGYPLNCVRFRQGIERGYRSENGLSVKNGTRSWLRRR